MYNPKPFMIEDPSEIEDLIKRNSFATLISNFNGELLISHLPINRFKDGKLYGHFAKNNLHASISEGSDITIVFSGPHAYISPKFYKTEFNVPTWNYAVVHCKGKIRYLEDREKVWTCFKEMVEVYESRTGWELPSEEKYRNLTSAIRFFYVENPSFEMKAKFNQNKSEEDINSVISSLMKNGDQKAAEYMSHINRQSN